MLHVDAGTLREDEGAGAVEAGGELSELEDGTREELDEERWRSELARAFKHDKPGAA